MSVLVEKENNKPCDMTSWRALIITRNNEICFASLSDMVTNSNFTTTSIGLILLVSAICADPDAVETTDLPSPITASNIYYITRIDQEARMSLKNISAIDEASRLKNRGKNSTLREALRVASLQGLDAMIDLYERKEPEILRKGQ